MENSEQPSAPSFDAQFGPVSRMMMSVAGHAITSYVQFRALAELLIEREIISREELEEKFSLMREDGLEQTIEEWFEPEIAYHLKMAVQSARAGEEGGAGVAPPDDAEIARARAMQAGQIPPGA